MKKDAAIEPHPTVAIQLCGGPLASGILILTANK